MKQKLQIIKIGGNILDDKDALSAFVNSFAALEGPKILVHGGGKSATELAGKLGVSQAMWQGRRITDSATLNIAVKVYAGLISKTIVAMLQASGVRSLGLSGADLGLIKAQRRNHPEIDFGFVGDITDDGVDSAMITLLLELGITPVFSAITHDGSGQLLNTNADTLASVIAVAMAGLYEVQLTYCFEKNGVLRDPEDDESFYRELNLAVFLKLKNEEIVSRGMIPKLETSFEAKRGGVSGVYIGNYRNLKKMILHDKDAGTEITA